MIVMALATGLTAACGDDRDGAAPAGSTAAPAAPKDFSGRGPYAVGVRRLALDEKRPVLVFYPVEHAAVPTGAQPFAYTPEDVWGSLAGLFPAGSLVTTSVDDAWPDLPVSTKGPFPLVIHSHARGSTYLFASRHNAQTASWGYVVVAPAHPGRDNAAVLTGAATRPWPTDQQTIFDTLSLLAAEQDRVGGPLHGAVDLDRVAVEGHSAGGRTAGVAAYDPRIDAWIGLAPVAPVPDDATLGRDVVTDSNDGFEPTKGEFDLTAYLAGHAPPPKPSMILTDDSSTGMAQDNRQIWSWLPSPKHLIVLTGTGWNVYMDYCELVQQRGGMQAVIDAFQLEGDALADVRLTEIGCLPSYAPVGEVTPVWNHLTVAFLDQSFGIDPAVATASLERGYLDATFPGRIADELSDP